MPSAHWTVLAIVLAATTAPLVATGAMLDIEERKVIAALCARPEVGPSDVECRIPQCDDGPIYIENVYRGAFSAPDAREAVVNFGSPCSSHAGNFSGDALLRHQAHGWEVVWVEPTMSNMQGGCVVVPGSPPPRALLVCTSAYAMQGFYRWSLVEAFVGRKRLKTRGLLGLQDEIAATCRDGADAPWFEPWEPAIDVADFSGDGLADVRIRVTAGRTRVSAEMCERIVEETYKAARIDLPGPRASALLVFRNSGSALTLDRASSADMKRLAELNEFPLGH